MKKEVIQKSHYKEIDFLYALGAVLTILGHSHPNDWSTFPGEWIEFIYLFHMPLFFCDSRLFTSLIKRHRAGRIWQMAYGKGTATFNAVFCIITFGISSEIHIGTR